eukprot:202145_1
MSLYSNLPPETGKESDHDVIPNSSNGRRIKLKTDSWSVKTLLKPAVRLKPKSVSSNSNSTIVGEPRSSPDIKKSKSRVENRHSSSPESPKAKETVKSKSLLKKRRAEDADLSDRSDVSTGTPAKKKKKSKKRVTFSKDTKKHDAEGPNKYHILSRNLAETNAAHLLHHDPSHQHLASSIYNAQEAEMEQALQAVVQQREQLIREREDRERAERERPLEPYDPARPNDYEEYCRERLQKQRHRAEEERLKVLEDHQRKQTEAFKSQNRAATAKSLSLSGEEAYLRRVAMSQGGSPAAGTGVPGSADQAPAAEGPKKGVEIIGKKSFAAKMMSKMGWKEGEGLGIQKQGITSMLVHGAGNTLMEENRMRSKVMCLMNLVGKGEVDESLLPETKLECERFGTVLDCALHEDKRITCPPEEAVTIFVKFGAEIYCEQAILSMNGRFFGGRIVRAMYFDETRFDKRGFECE